MIDSYVQIFVSDGANTTSNCSSKTTRQFQQNNTSFSSKQHVTFNKTTRRFQQNNTSLSTKHHVGVEFTEHDSKGIF